MLSKRAGVLAAALATAGLLATAPTALAQVGSGNWTPDSPSFKVQQKGCGKVSDLTFTLSCSSDSGEQRAERRYETYSGGTHQFEGYFKITSQSGSRISLKQTFHGDQGPFFLLAVEKGGRMYSVEGGQTISGGATVGTEVRVNTINQVGKSHQTYINGSLKHTTSSPGGEFYDKFGAYRTASGAGPITVTWSKIRFWHR